MSQDERSRSSWKNREKDELHSKKEVETEKSEETCSPRMVQLCADAMDPWERMELREKRRKKRLWKKK